MPSNEVEAPPRKILPIIYVIDTSGSMAYDRIGAVNQAMYGTVEGVQIGISDQATLTTKDQSNSDVIINLWQQNMFAVRAEIEIGFRADVSCFNVLGRTHSA